MKTRFLFILLAAAFAVPTAHAEEVQKGSFQWETTEKTVAPAGSRPLDLAAFDDDKDGVLSREEVGAHMFKMYDTDGNQVVDNKEYERKAVMTVVPAQKETKMSYDFNGDGTIDKTTETGEDFMKQTGLARFNAKGDGLSPHEFMQRNFLQADVNRDHVIDIKEWQGSYIAAIDAKNKADALYNK